MYLAAVLNVIFIVVNPVLASDVPTIPVFVKEPPQQVFSIERQYLHLQCTVKCGGCIDNVDVYWQKDGVNIPFQNLNTLNESFVSLSLEISSFSSSRHSGKYVCVAELAEVAVRSRPSEVVLAEIFPVALSPQDVLIGASAVFKCSSLRTKSKLKLSTRWAFNGKLLDESRGYVFGLHGELIIPQVVHGDSGIYSCERFSPLFNFSSSSNGSTSLTIKSDSAENVSRDPKIVHLSRNQELEVSDKLQIICVAGPSPGLLAKLLKRELSGVEIEVAKGKQWLMHGVDAVSVADTGSYICETQVGPLRVRQETVVTVLASPVIHDDDGITFVPKRQDESLSLTCEAAGFPQPKIHWYHNKQPVSDAKDVVYESRLGWLQIDHLKPEHAGWYECVAENSVGRDFALFYVTIDVSEFAPKSILVEATSCTSANVTWLPPSSLPSRPNFYIIEWYDTDSGTSSEQYTQNTWAVISTGLYCGESYKFKVCVLRQAVSKILECAVAFATIPEKVPLIGPPIVDLRYKGDQDLEVLWSEIPLTQRGGKIVMYTIYVEDISSDPHKTITFNASAAVLQHVVKLPNKGVYRICMTASSRMGEGPRGKQKVIGIDENSKIDTDSPKVSAKWVYLESKNVAEITWEKPVRSTVELTAYVVDYVQLPLEGFTRSGISQKVPAGSYKLLFENLNKEALYKFTVTPFSNELSGYSGTALLHKSIDSYLHFQHTILPDPIVIEAPEDIVAVAHGHEGVFVTWNEPNIKRKYAPTTFLKEDVELQGYELHLFDETKIASVQYRTDVRHITFQGLQPGRWYFFKIKAIVDARGKSDVLVFSSKIESCKVSDVAPSPPRNVTYSPYYLPADSSILLFVYWEPPASPGGWLTMYNMYVTRLLPGFPFATRVKTLPLRDDNLNLLGLSVTVAGKFRYQIEVAAVNDAGEGERAVVQTPYIDKQPISDWDRPDVVPSGVTFILTGTAREPLKKTEQSRAPSQPISETSIGIISGCAIAGFFLLLFLVVLVIKKPFRRKHGLPSPGPCSTEESPSHPFLYLKRLRDAATEDITCTGSHSSGLLQPSSSSDTSQDCRCVGQKSLIYRNPFYKLYLKVGWLAPNRQPSGESAVGIMPTTASSTCACSLGSTEGSVLSRHQEVC